MNAVKRMLGCTAKAMLISGPTVKPWLNATPPSRAYLQIELTGVKKNDEFTDLIRILERHRDTYLEEPCEQALRQFLTAY